MSGICNLRMNSRRYSRRACRHPCATHGKADEVTNWRQNSSQTLSGSNASNYLTNPSFVASFDPWMRQWNLPCKYTEKIISSAKDNFAMNIGEMSNKSKTPLGPMGKEAEEAFIKAYPGAKSVEGNISCLDAISCDGCIGYEIKVKKDGAIKISTTNLFLLLFLTSPEGKTFLSQFRTKFMAIARKTRSQGFKFKKHPIEQFGKDLWKQHKSLIEVVDTSLRIGTRICVSV